MASPADNRVIYCPLTTVLPKFPEEGLPYPQNGQEMTLGVCSQEPWIWSWVQGKHSSAAGRRSWEAWLPQGHRFCSSPWGPWRPRMRGNPHEKGGTALLHNQKALVLSLGKGKAHSRFPASCPCNYPWGRVIRLKKFFKKEETQYFRNLKSIYPLTL